MTKALLFISLLHRDRAEEGDVVIKCLDGSEIMTEMAVLCKQSEVFTRMFASKATKESTKGMINIDDAEPRALNQLVSYLTNNELPSNIQDDDLADLLVLADKYMIEKLKEDSAHALTLKTDLALLPTVLVVSFMCHCDQLYAASIRRVAHNITACRTIRGWEQMTENQSIMADLLNHMAVVGMKPC